jgi:hypothetical protein
MGWSHKPDDRLNGSIAVMALKLGGKKSGREEKLSVEYLD